MGKKRNTKIKRQNKNAPGAYQLILGDVGNRPAYAIALRNSQNEYTELVGNGWICERGGGLSSPTSKSGQDLTIGEFEVLLDNAQYIDNDWLKEEDEMNESAVEAAFDHAKHFCQGMLRARWFSKS